MGIARNIKGASLNSKAKGKIRCKKIYERKKITGKGKNVAKVVDQTFIKLIWRLKDKSSENNHNY